MLRPKSSAAPRGVLLTTDTLYRSRRRRASRPRGIVAVDMETAAIGMVRRARHPVVGVPRGQRPPRRRPARRRGSRRHGERGRHANPGTIARYLLSRPAASRADAARAGHARRRQALDVGAAGGPAVALSANPASGRAAIRATDADSQERAAPDAQTSVTPRSMTRATSFPDSMRSRARRCWRRSPRAATRPRATTGRRVRRCATTCRRSTAPRPRPPRPRAPVRCRRGTTTRSSASWCTGAWAVPGGRRPRSIPERVADKERSRLPAAPGRRREVRAPQPVHRVVRELAEHRRHRDAAVPPRHLRRGLPVHRLPAAVRGAVEVVPRRRLG